MYLRLERLPFIALLTLSCFPFALEAEETPWERAQKKAMAHLDQRANGWLSFSDRGRDTSCVSCHTGVPYMLSRTIVRRAVGQTEPGDAEKRTLDGIKKRVGLWKDIKADNAAETAISPYYSGGKLKQALGTESIINALLLTNADVAKGGPLSEEAKTALKYMWAEQRDDGGWHWLDFGLRPWEKEAEYFGTSLAALAVGLAGDAGQQEGDLDALRNYLDKKYASQPLHNRIFALWASAHLDGVLSAERKKALLEESKDLQSEDGSWTLAKLAKKVDGKQTWTIEDRFPNDAKGDGYSTGLILFVLQEAETSDDPTDDPHTKKGLAWLKKQAPLVIETGTWPAVYLNKDRDTNNFVGNFMRDASTSYALMALLRAKANAD